jgi:predicted secreted protein
MSENYGRNVTFEWGDVTYKAREKNLTIDGEPANITDDHDDGIQRLLEEDSELAVTIELTGIYKVATLREAKLNKDTREEGTLTYVDEGTTISGTFNLGAYSEGQPYDDAITYTASFMSTGPVVPGTVSSGGD